MLQLIGNVRPREYYVQIPRREFDEIVGHCNNFRSSRQIACVITTDWHRTIVEMLNLVLPVSRILNIRAQNPLLSAWVIPLTQIPDISLHFTFTAWDCLQRVATRLVGYFRVKYGQFVAALDIRYRRWQRIDNLRPGIIIVENCRRLLELPGSIDRIGYLLFHGIRQGISGGFVVSSVMAGSAEVVGCEMSESDCVSILGLHADNETVIADTISMDAKGVSPLGLASVIINFLQVRPECRVFDYWVRSFDMKSQTINRRCRGITLFQ